MPISQERELEIELELAAIVRELERRPPTEKRGAFLAVPGENVPDGSHPMANGWPSSTMRPASTRCMSLPIQVLGRRLLYLRRAASPPSGRPMAASCSFA